MSQTFAAFIKHESDNEPIRGLARIVPRDRITSTLPSMQELDEIRWGHKLNGPSYEVEIHPTSSTSTPVDLEQSLLPTPKRHQTVDALVQSATNPRKNRWRLLGAGVMYTMMGLSDAVTGAVLPYMEEDYNIGYAVVSMIFVANAAGFILAAPLNAAIDRKLGRSRTYVLVTSLATLGYTLILCGLPFPVVIVAYFFLGFALGIFLAMTNLFVVNLLNGTVILGIMAALYGAGGIVSPIIATNMISHGAKWSHFYAIPLALAVISMGLMGWAFQGFEADVSAQLLSALERTASRQATALGEPTHVEILKRALKMRATIFGSLFILFYQGAEVAISGWVISFLINYRNGNPAKVGNVTAGFWGGITLGRIVLTPIAPRIGEKLAVAILVVIAAGLQILVWLVPNIIGIAVAESLVGLALGPVYPCATAVLSRLLPGNVQISAMSFVTSMGSSGGALIPLITGLMAQRLGTVVLHPIVLICCASMIVSWVLLPKVAKRTE